MNSTRVLRAVAPILFAFFATVGVPRAGCAQDLAPSLAAVFETAPDDSFTVWIFFQDRVLTSAKERDEIASLGSVWCARSLRRRAKVRTGSLLDATDLPVEKDWIARVEEAGVRVRGCSRWLNAVSGVVRGADLRTLAALPMVRHVTPVGRYHNPRFETAKATAGGADDPLYGPGYDQVDLIQATDLHGDYGLSGQGIRIALLDSRFDREHECLRHLKVFAEWDFVDGDPNTAYETGDPTDDRAGHGTMTLSVIGGYRAGRLIGPAYGADYVLARTELSSSETPVEEDYWVQGLEWAESLGVDIVSSSLGYLDWYGWQDLDGNTAVTTRAADMAVSKGVLVVNSAGNEGEGDGIHGTLIAPADGDSVLAVGAVWSNEYRASFSSVGPTADGRVKPDVMGQGAAAYVASPSDFDGYQSANGTSFSAPLVAGLAALLLEAHPEWTPWDVITALKSTASRAHAPDVYYGWGICRGLDALAYGGGITSPPASPGTSIVSTNPFRPGDRISVSGARPDFRPDIRIYDCLGRLVFSGRVSSEAGALRWDAVDLNGSPVAPGVYFARCAHGDFGPAHKIVLVR